MSIVEFILMFQVAAVFVGATWLVNALDVIPYIGIPMAAILTIFITFFGGLIFSLWLLLTGRITGFVGGFLKITAAFTPGGQIVLVFYETIAPKIPALGSLLVGIKGGAKKGVKKILISNSTKSGTAEHTAANETAPFVKTAQATS